MKRLLARRYGSEAGIALPMTLILMGLLTALTVAFLAFTSAEPVIAANHMANAQARAIAESGLERALWALTKGDSTPGFAGSLATPLPNPSPAPYDGSQFVNVGVGQFKVTVTNGAAVNERNIEAVGYVPTAANPIAIKKISTTVTRLKKLDPPCAVCAGGEAPVGITTNIRIGGSAEITAANTGNNYCAGVTPQAAAYSAGSVNTNGNPDLTGPSGGSAIKTNQPQSNFTDFMFSDYDMAVLKALAKANGTYYQGNQTWSSPPPNGIVFVDTPSGNPLSITSPSSDLITVDIHGNWSQGWNGWLIVAGSIDMSGNRHMSGLIYAQNDISMHGSGNGSITGAVISTNRIDSQSTNVDTDALGNAPVFYNCRSVRDGGGTIPQNWFIKPGTYREVSGTS
jgi:Tfp pilus assembly protein PilX